MISLKIKGLGIAQIILGIIALIANAVARNLFKFFSIKDLISFLFSPVSIFSALIIVLGAHFIKNGGSINIGVDKLFVFFGEKIKDKHMGMAFLIAGILILLIELVWSGIFTEFSASRLGTLLFDDAKIPFTAFAVFFILTGIHFLGGRKE